MRLRIHVLDDGFAKLRSTEQDSIWHQTLKVISNRLIGWWSMDDDEKSQNG